MYLICAIATFFVSSSSLSERIAQHRVDLLFLLFPCGNLSFPQGRVRGLLANRISPLYFVPLVFSTSSVGKLWVYRCWGAFSLGGGSFWLRVVFPLALHSRSLLISIANLSWMEVNFLTVSVYTIINWCFSIQYFLKRCFEWIYAYFHLRSL